jgi:geranylgeranyl diphosphate synthase type II
VCQDVVHGRPSAAIELGVPAAIERIDSLVSDLVEAVPACPGRNRLCRWLEHACTRLYPRPAPSVALSVSA